MSDKTAKGLAKRAKNEPMTAEMFIDEVRGILNEAALEYPGEPKKSVRWKLARKFKMSPRRVKAYDNNEVRQVPAQELETARDTIAACRKARAERIRRELATLEILERDYERQRAEFLRRYPLADRFIPAADHEAGDLLEAAEDQARDPARSIQED